MTYGGITMVDGIDVSQWQGKINWEKVSVDFAVIRAGYGRLSSQKDTQFDDNYIGCRIAGIPCGAYWFAYAVTPDEARLEAEACLEVIKDKKFEYPIYYDVEDQRILALGKSAVSAIIRAFLDTMEKSGYFVGLYMSADDLKEYADEDIRARYAVWVADYGVSKPDYSGNYGMWQRSSTGRVEGIDGDVDLDKAFENYPEIIRSAGLNGYGKDEDPDRKHRLTVLIDDKVIVKNYEF